MASPFSGAATPVSGSGVRSSSEFGQTGQLARSSHQRSGVTFLLLVLGALGASGCIVPEAPDYDPPTTTAPVVDGYNAIPTNNLSQPFKKTEINQIRFEVPFRSEDAGQEVWAGVYVDYGSGTSTEVVLPNFDRRFEPSTYDDRKRRISFRIQGDVTVGCHTLTLFVTHLRNTLEDDVGERYLDEEAAQGDLGVATWFINIYENEATPLNTLVGCPAPYLGPR